MLLKLPGLYRGSYIIQTAINEFNFSYENNTRRWVADKLLSFGMSHKDICPYDKDKYFAVRVYHEIRDVGIFKSGNRFKMDILMPVYTIDLSTSIAENISDHSDATKILPCDLTFDQIAVHAFHIVGKLNYPINAPFPSILKRRMFVAIGGLDSKESGILLLEEKETEYDSKYDPEGKIIKFETASL